MKECLLLQTPKEQNSAGCEAFWPQELLTAFICYSLHDPEQAVSLKVSAQPEGEGRSSAKHTHSDWVASLWRRWFGYSVTPPVPIVQKGNMQDSLLFPVLPTFIFIIVIIFLHVCSSSFQQHHAGLVNAIFFFFLNTKGAACSSKCTLVLVVGNRANATLPGTTWLSPSSDCDALGGVWACLQLPGQASLMLFISGHQRCSEHEELLLTGPTSSLRGARTH